MKLYFTDVFDVSEETLAEYGAFNVSLVTDLPLFIDPFLLFNSDKPEYRALHDDIIKYLRFLKDQSVLGHVSSDRLNAWYYFPEVKQNCLGFSVSGHSGRGLGKSFAGALNENMHNIFTSFGDEKVTKGSHLEKLCLVADGVGRDMISDFTTNLIKDFLCRYTETFAKQFLKKECRKLISVSKVRFNYVTKSWMSDVYELPYLDGDYVLLTPRDILTRDDTWINKQDMLRNFEAIPEAINDSALRGQINAYLCSVLPKEPIKKDYDKAFGKVLLRYPQLIDYFIKCKEDTGDDSVAVSRNKVDESDMVYVRQFGTLVDLLDANSLFYKISGTTKDETRQRIEFFKDIVENKGGYRIFYSKGQPISNETDVHILFRMTWFATPSDISREVNDGRGPVDFKVSRGAHDKTLVEFKLASNSHLRKNLEKQLELYQKASDAQTGFKVIIYFSLKELVKVEKTLLELGLNHCGHIFLVDARNDNKPSGSKA